MNAPKKQPEGAKSMIRASEAALEIAAFVLLYYILWRNGYETGIFPSYFGMGKYVLMGLYGVLVVVLFRCFDGVKFGYLKLSDVLVSQWIAMFMVNFITYWQLCLIANVMITPVPLLVLMVLDMAVSFVCCTLYTWVYHRLYAPKRMLMIYGREDAVVLKFKMDSRRDKYRVTGLISEKEGFDAIRAQIDAYNAVILNDVSAELRNEVLKYCYGKRVRTYLTPKLSDIIARGATEITLFDTPLLLVKGKGLTPSQRAAKRCMDILISGLALIVASPVMLVVAVAIKLEDGGPVLFRQKRATLNGRVFEILKFRSMIVDAEKNGEVIPATDHDPRITRVGKVIRATRLDELPQLLNILKGDMSVVGPRPERVEHMEAYSREIPEFPFRLKVKGGLTGYAQIYGKYNTSPYDKLRLDLMYIEHYSLLLDIKLILMTIRIMLKKDSTEGFDKAAELEQLQREMMRSEAPETGESRESACIR